MTIHGTSGQGVDGWWRAIKERGRRNPSDESFICMSINSCTLDGIKGITQLNGIWWGLWMFLLLPKTVRLVLQLYGDLCCVYLFICCAKINIALVRGNVWSRFVAVPWPTTSYSVVPHVSTDRGVYVGAVLVSSLNVIGKVAANLLILLHVTVTFLRLFSFNNLWRTMVLLSIIKWWGCAEALRGSKGNSPETPFLPS